MSKSHLLALSLFALSMTLMSCGHKSEQNTGNIDTTETPLAVEQGPGRDDKRVLNNEVELDNHKYRLEVTCAPDDTLPQVKDRFGDPYLDNRVTLVVHRDGELLARRSFTKADFLAVYTGAASEQFILGGMAFNKASASGFTFGAVLNGPGDEEGGLAFKVTIPLDGIGAARIEFEAEQSNNDYDEAN